MDINRDEIRRQLAASQQEQAEAMPRWQAALDATVGQDRSGAGASPMGSGPSDERTATVLGVPSRRGFLRIGGMTFAGAALAAACTPAPEEVQIAQTGSLPKTPETVLYEPLGDIATDITLLRVAQSIEQLAIAAYGAALGTDLLPAAVADAAKLFRDQHTEHFGLLRGKVQEIGGESYDEPNPVLKTALLDPAAQAITDGTLTLDAVVALALDLEDAAAQTYTNAASLLTTADLRQTLMSIGGVEARHVAILLGVQSPGNAVLQVPFPFEKTAGAVKPRSDAVKAVGSGGSVPSSTTSTRRATTTTAASAGSTSTSGSSTTGSGAGAASTTSSIATTGSSAGVGSTSTTA